MGSEGVRTRRMGSEGVRTRRMGGEGVRTRRMGSEGVRTRRMGSEGVRTRGSLDQRRCNNGPSLNSLLTAVSYLRASPDNHGRRRNENTSRAVRDRRDVRRTFTGSGLRRGSPRLDHRRCRHELHMRTVSVGAPEGHKRLGAFRECPSHSGAAQHLADERESRRQSQLRVVQERCESWHVVGHFGLSDRGGAIQHVGNVVATGDKKKEQQEFPLILVPLSLWGAGWAEVSTANHHIRHAVALYTASCPRRMEQCSLKEE